MNKAIPQDFLDAWEDMVIPAVFTTVDTNGIPNSVYVGCFKLLDNQQIVIANNKFHKTQENILNGSSGSFLFITNKRVSYQVKGNITYYTNGKIYDDMKKWLEPKYPGYGAAVLNIEKIYSGKRGLL